MKKIFSLIFIFFVCFQASKNWIIFGKFNADVVLKSFSGRNKSLEAPVFGFFHSFPHNLEESREYRALIRWVLG